MHLGLLQRLVCNGQIAAISFAGSLFGLCAFNIEFYQVYENIYDNRIKTHQNLQNSYMKISPFQLGILLHVLCRNGNYPQGYPFNAK